MSASSGKKPAQYLASSSGEVIPIVQATLEPSPHHQSSHILPPSRLASSSSRSMSSSASRSPSAQPPPPPLASLSPTYQQLPPLPTRVSRNHAPLPPAVIPGLGIGGARQPRVGSVLPPALAPLPLPLSPPPPAATTYESLACAKAANSFRQHGERARLPDADWRHAAGTGLTLGESIGPRVGGLRVPPPPPPAPIGVDGLHGSLSSALSAGLAAPDPIMSLLPPPPMLDGDQVKLELGGSLDIPGQSHLSPALGRSQHSTSSSSMQMLSPLPQPQGGLSDAFVRMDEGYVPPLSGDSQQMMNSRAPPQPMASAQPQPIATPTRYVEVDLTPPLTPTEADAVEGLTSAPLTATTGAHQPEGVSNTASGAMSDSEETTFIDPMKMMDEAAELGTPFDDVSSAGVYVCFDVYLCICSHDFS